MTIKTTSEITVKLIDHLGSDADIAAAAKVLEPEAYQTYLLKHEKHSVAGIINYMLEHRHGTPFEHGCIRMFVHAPIFVWREWHRHRIGFAYTDYGGVDGDGTLGMSFNEESARYKQLDPVFYIPPRHRPMMKVDGWKPGRPKFLGCGDQNIYDRLVKNLTMSYTVGYDCYLDNLEMGIDPGLARDCLPVGIYSSCWVTTNPRALMHFLSLRVHEPEASYISYPLYEIEVAAQLAESILAEHWPLTQNAFVNNGRVGP